MSNFARKMRGGAEIDALLKEMDALPADSVPEELVEAGKRLLEDLSTKTRNRVLNSQELRALLAATVANTTFADTPIVEVQGRLLFEEFDIYQGLSTIVNRSNIFSGDAYNVWFARENGSWALKFNRIPEGGNLR